MSFTGGKRTCDDELGSYEVLVKQLKRVKYVLRKKNRFVDKSRVFVRNFSARTHETLSMEIVSVVIIPVINNRPGVVFYEPVHLLSLQDLSNGQSVSLLQPTLHTGPSQISPLRQSSSFRHSGLQTDADESHFSLPWQLASDEHTGRQESSPHEYPAGHSRFSVHGSAGVRTHAILAVGFGTNPGRHEHVALWLATAHTALGPHGIARHGLVHALSRHDSTDAQSSFDLHPNKHMLFRHMCPKKQSLSTLQATEKSIDRDYCHR